MSAEVSRYDQKLEYILKHSARIFAEKGYHSTSMRDIARETRVSLSGLYHYCESKDELLFLIQDNCFHRVLERARSRLREVNDPALSIRLFIENHLAFFAANMAEMKVLSHESESLGGELGQKVSSTKREYTKLARGLLEDLQNSDSANSRSVDLTIATYALFGMMNWIYNWYDPAGKLSVEELIDNVVKLFLNGFTGHEINLAVIPPGKASHQQPSVWRTDV